MSSLKRKSGTRGRADSYSAVSNARSIQKTVKGTRGAYDETIENSPLEIRPASELLDDSSDANADTQEDG
jgi:hypothetical protein